MRGEAFEAFVDRRDAASAVVPLEIPEGEREPDEHDLLDLHGYPIEEGGGDRSEHKTDRRELTAVRREEMEAGVDQPGHDQEVSREHRKGEDAERAVALRIAEHAWKDAVGEHREESGDAGTDEADRAERLATRDEVLPKQEIKHRFDLASGVDALEPPALEPGLVWRA